MTPGSAFTAQTFGERTLNEKVSILDVWVGEDSAFRFYLEDVPRVWLEGSKAEATLSHGMSLSIPAFITAVIAHPKVTGKAATAWPKPVQP
ncbi:hypothetical protein ACQR36_23290 [Rhodococcus erythropolis]|uniref:hypothetical protein n=1 Tax=Rhodococcus erythropolis TaxID=1833 RepID=UPI00366F0AFA